MGLLDYAMGEMQKTVKSNYKSMTGRDYDSDFRNYMYEYESKDDIEVRDRWEELVDNRGVRYAAEKAAVRQIMLERGFSLD